MPESYGKEFNNIFQMNSLNDGMPASKKSLCLFKFIFSRIKSNLSFRIIKCRNDKDLSSKDKH